MLNYDYFTKVKKINFIDIWKNHLRIIISLKNEKYDNFKWVDFIINECLQF